MFAIFAALPVIGNIITALTTAFFNAKVSMVQARIGGDKEVATKMVQAAAMAEHENTAKLSILAGNKLLTLLVIAFATPLVLFEWKCVVYDIIWMGGATSTDAIKGQLADWASTIIACLFGSTTVLTAGKLFFGRDKAGE